jgi:hypothetical protein
MWIYEVSFSNLVRQHCYISRPLPILASISNSSSINIEMYAFFDFEPHSPHNCSFRTICYRLGAMGFARRAKKPFRRGPVLWGVVKTLGDSTITFVVRVFVPCSSKIDIHMVLQKSRAAEANLSTALVTSRDHTCYSKGKCTPFSRVLRDLTSRAGR